MAPGLGTTLKDATWHCDDERAAAVFAKLLTTKLDAAQAKLVDAAMAEALLMKDVSVDLKLDAVTWLLDRKPRPAKDPKAQEPFRTARAIVDLLVEDPPRTREVLSARAETGDRRERLVAALDQALVDGRKDARSDAAKVRKVLEAWKRQLSVGADDGVLQRRAAADLLQRGAPKLEEALPVFDEVEGQVLLDFSSLMTVVSTIRAMADDGDREELALVCEFARRMLPKLQTNAKVRADLVAACTKAARKKKDTKALAALSSLERAPRTTR